jgi:hypothetical protein
MTKVLARWRARGGLYQKSGAKATTEEHSLSDHRTLEKRDAAIQLRKGAGDTEARIAQMVEMEEKSFWLCEEGHESAESARSAFPLV